MISWLKDLWQKISGSEDTKADVSSGTKIESQKIGDAKESDVGQIGKKKEEAQLMAKVQSVNPNNQNPYLNYINTATELGSLAYGIYRDSENSKLAKDTLAWQKNYDKQSLAFAQQQFAESVRQYNQNFSAEQQALAQSQYNFENAYQIQARDMAKAGLNPLNAGNASGFQQAFSGGSSVSGNPGSSSVGNTQIQSQIPALITSLIESKISSDTAKDVAKISASASKYSADKQAETAGAVLEQRKAEFSENISLAFAEHDEKVRVNKVKEELERIGLSNDQARIKADKIAHDEEIRHAYEQLELEKQKEARAKSQEEKRISAQKQRSWLMFIGDRIDNLVDLGKSIFLGGSSNSGHRRGIGFGNDEGW